MACSPSADSASFTYFKRTVHPGDFENKCLPLGPCHLMARSTVPAWHLACLKKSTEKARVKQQARSGYFQNCQVAQLACKKCKANREMVRYLRNQKRAIPKTMPLAISFIKLFQVLALVYLFGLLTVHFLAITQIQVIF